jgi:DNA-binding CsgD family transcriptional regulator
MPTLTSKIKEARKRVLLALEGSNVSEREIALAFRSCLSTVYLLRKACGLPRPLQVENEERNAELERLYRSGVTLDDLGNQFGITRERVRQIMDKRGVPAGAGRNLRTMERAKQRELQRRSMWDERAMSIYGCSFELAKELNNGLVFSAKRSPARLYIDQRKNSIRRGIHWEISFPEWMRLWKESGKFELRGRGGYVMARIGDSGPYKVDNVEIITNSQNTKDSYLVVSAEERSKKRASSGWRPILDPTHMSPRVKEACALHVAGLTVSEIALRMGTSRRNAWQYVDQAKRKLALMQQAESANQPAMAA